MLYHIKRTMSKELRDKLIYDPIHGYMKFSGVVLHILDTVVFKRLQDIRQLGACYYVFPGASHNRFEHSLGVAHLAEKMMNGIASRQPELQITPREIELIKIAGLCHDLGHGPFSHAFDNEILPRLLGDTPYREHEWRSGQLLRQIVKDRELHFTEEELVFIETCIHPNPEEVHSRPFLYEIVSNATNGIDVDKFDYLRRDPYNLGLDYHFNSDRLIDQARVIEGHICFPEKLGSAIMQMASVRYNFLRDICNHPVVKAIEYMITDAILAAEPVLGLAEKTRQLDFTYVTDNILYTIKTGTDPRLAESKHILNALCQRQMYHYVGEYKAADVETARRFTKEGFRDSLLDQYKFDKEDYLIHYLHLSYSNTRTYPLESVGFYRLSEPDKVTRLHQDKLGMLLPETFCENTTVRIFSRRKHEAVQAAYDRL